MLQELSHFALEFCGLKSKQMSGHSGNIMMQQSVQNNYFELHRDP